MNKPILGVSVMLLIACNGSSAGGGALAQQDAPAEDASTPDAPDLPPSEPKLEAPLPVSIDEEVEATIPLVSSGLTRFDAEGLPPGARIDAATGTITFRPDFTQSGAYAVTITGRAAEIEKTVHAKISVRDSIAPPAPTVVSTTTLEGSTRLVVRQTTDAFLDSPGHAGRTFDAVVVVPTIPQGKSAPVVVSLHGFGGAPNASATSTTTFRIEPHDPDNTYWWGYGETLPGAAPAGHVPPYTLRRVLHLLDWLLHTYPAADPDRVFAAGGSMGGAGAMTLGLLFARHFAGIDATIGQAIPRNHRPSRIAQLSGLWGSPVANVGGLWDEIDLTRVMREHPEARDQFVFTKHGKDDPTIHFGAVVLPSPLTLKTFYGMVEDEHIGHYSVWDEGAHGPADPVMGERWWDASWSRITDARSFLSRRTAFPAFSRASVNGHPGDGSGNGKVVFNAETGFSAKLAVAGDCGWSGDLAGALNRFLRWDASAVVDTRDSFSMPLFVVTSPGSAPPATGYPTKGNLYSGALPVTTDVTMRRTQRFRPLPGQTVHWTLGAAKGDVQASADGSVTVPGLPLTATPTLFTLAIP